jgi:hypothetical protein
MIVHRFKRLGFAALLLASFAWSSGARSQPIFQGTDASQEADGHFLKGKALLKAGDVRGAYEEYRAAWQLKKTYDIAANLGNLEVTLGMHRDAAEHLAFALRNYAPSGATPDKIERVRQLLAQARAEVGALSIKANVDGAEVLVDGNPVGRAPIEGEVFVEAGSRSVDARLSGYEAAHLTVSVEKGASQTVTLTLAPVTVPPPPAPAPTTSVATSTATRRPVALLVAGGVLAAGGLALGTGLTVAANGNGSAADAAVAMLSHSGPKPPCATSTSLCTTIDGDRRAHDALAKGAAGAFVAGGAIGIATLGYALLAPRRSPSTGTRLVPVVAQDHAGLSVVGVW